MTVHREARCRPMRPNEAWSLDFIHDELSNGQKFRAQRAAPKYLFADNGAEFTGQLVDLWAYHHGTRIDFSRPGKPTDNAFIETFNGSLCDECLNIHWFETIARREG